MDSPTAQTEKELLLLASQANEQAFTALFHLYKNKLYSYVLRLTDSEMLAEDIVQDVFLKLWNDRALLADVGHFGGYVFRMSKNHVINHFRRMSHETLILADLFSGASGGHNDIQEMLAVKDVEKVLQEIVSKLPAQQKAVYHLTREEGRTHEEIANLLNISPNTVKNHAVQAMLTIRTQLRRHADVMLAIVMILSLKK